MNGRWFVYLTRRASTNIPEGYILSIFDYSDPNDVFPCLWSIHFQKNVLNQIIIFATSHWSFQPFQEWLTAENARTGETIGWDRNKCPEGSFLPRTDTNASSHRAGGAIFVVNLFVYLLMIVLLFWNPIDPAKEEYIVSTSHNRL